MTETQSSDKKNQPVIVAGVRTPFVRSHSAFANLAAHDLGRLALSGLVSKTDLDPKLLQHITMGCVIHDPVTSNVAREAMLGADLPSAIPAHTVSLACISSNVAATSLSDMISMGRIDVAIFGGLDTCSDPPIRLSKNLRKTLVKLQKVRKPLDLLKHMDTLKKIKLRDILPDVPKVVEFSNGKSMGEGAEILAQQVGVTREETDAYAARSHRLAVEAQSKGIFTEDVLAVHVPPKFESVDTDNGPRADATLERLAKLRPAFDRKHGVCTAGNSSFLTDGASAVLMMSRERAKALSYEPKAVVKDYVYTADDAMYGMLSGPSVSIPRLLHKNKLSFDDIGVWEIHEAFASQMVANLKLLADKSSVKERVGVDCYGEIPLEKLNIWGGSLSLGHPFGATGGRLLWTAARRLVEEGARYAVVSGCAAGGHGSAILLENIES